ncbi:MAG: 50S ribosomal protein L21 [Deltaproteobacteria bacterium]|jgi:large subunit ribosomal protein L21|nr:MAG: 50S ribosomal protein L21 [Deltaproteobacteria bacterium]
MPYAIVRTGGKQHRVQQGERLKVDRLEGDVGAELVLGEILLLGGNGEATVGTPLVSGAQVTAKIVTQGRGAKIRVFKRRKRKGFHKTIGHRQYFTEIEITQIPG